MSHGPAKRNPVRVGFSYIFVDIAAKFFRTTGVGTNIELAFIDAKGRWIAVLHFAFAQVISAEASILRNISGRILAKRDFVAHRTTIPLSFAILLGFQGRLAALRITGAAIATMRPERNEIGCVFIIR